MRRFAAALIVISLCASSASADSTSDILQRFGLIGTWSTDCNHPATRSHFFETFFRDANGLARRDVDRGAEIPIVKSFIDNAEIVSPTVLKGRIRNADKNWGPLDNLSYEFVLIKEDDPQAHEPLRFRFLESAASDGRVIAKGGILLKLGKPTFWEYKCRSGLS